MQLYTCTCLMGRLCVTLRRLEDVQRQLLLQLLAVDIPQAAVADVGGEVGEGWAWGLRPVARRTSSDRRTTRQPRLHHLTRHPAAVCHLLRAYNVRSPSLVIEQRINVSVHSMVYNLHRRITGSFSLMALTYSKIVLKLDLIIFKPNDTFYFTKPLYLLQTFFKLVLR